MCPKQQVAGRLPPIPNATRYLVGGARFTVQMTGHPVKMVEEQCVTVQNSYTTVL
jgi:hypothetical protein